MSDLNDKAFDFAADLAKQLISLSTIIIAITVTFSKDVFENPTDCEKQALLYAWVSYFSCIIFGIWLLMALVGTLAETKLDKSSKTITAANCRVPSFLQILSFLVGLFFTIYYAVISL
ncbi:hypothetical protein HJ093_22410 [Vibrio parahaemolyticus]|uniref:hypothetical protein n=1 Tax=Vibrio parahaemolyticus TaxID=670 RepID=UPI00186973C8|nr:hypothetical protein [Vibrio parahaemolyticus]EJL7851815.1 hypothetical protein [Vibrio parahaemolyticus]MBE4195946.1 hypothetical protein [Vibrio parahaemolyticus]MBO0236442.1 hypothetical protein [Vibrio parahaemolyticus]